MAELRAQPGFEQLSARMSRAGAHRFHRFKVRLKREVVTMGQPQVNPRARVGRYVSHRE